MTAPLKRQVVIRPDEAGYVVTFEPFGECRTLRTYRAALRHAEGVASDASCSMLDRSGWQPIAGDRGAVHLIGSPAVIVARENTGCWVALVVRPPWGMGNLDREYWGADAEVKAGRYAARLIANFKSLADAAADARDQKVSQRSAEALKVRSVAR